MPRVKELHLWIAGFFVMEIWKEIKGYNGRYYVSNYGRLKSLYKGVKIIRPGNVNGYMSVVLHDNTVRKTRTIHRLVGIYFIPNPDNLPQINHKDFNRSNNHVDNLEWCTNRYNVNHSISAGRMFRGELNKSRGKLKEYQVREIRLLLEKRVTLSKIASKYNINPRTVGAIKSGKIWGWLK